MKSLLFKAKDLVKRTSVNYRWCGQRKFSRLAEEQRRPMDIPEVQPVPGWADMYSIVANRRFVI